MTVKCPEFPRWSVVVVGATVCALAQVAVAQDLRPPPQPSENRITEEKRVLGKLLFWEEQLSTDNTMACGTCHAPSRGGNDARLARNPGLDGLLNTADDVRGSGGVIASDASNQYSPAPAFGLAQQVTGRTANSFLMAAYAPALFWDGRATSRFADPVSGQTVITAGGALESQVVGPPLNSVEMAHVDRDWVSVASKLESAVPMRLATDLPPDMAAAVADGASYPDLFAAAFGDPEITPTRIAFAIATYERTTIPDQTPFDRFVRGEQTALTQQQQRGLGAIQGVGCTVCHAPPHFSDQSFRNIGLRPVAEDRGRQDVTGSNADRGRFKVPTLRNAGLKRTFMHTGQFTTLAEVLRFYARAPGTQQFRDNQDPIMQLLRVPTPVQTDIIAFIEGGLTDPRVASEEFPFDRPTLHSERAQANPSLTGAGVAGGGGLVPQIIAVDPPSLGNSEFRIGLGGALGNTTATLAISNAAPLEGEILASETRGPLLLPGIDAGEGFATVNWPIGSDPAQLGDVVYFQWRVDDPSAPSGLALSAVARVEIFSFADESEPDPDPPLPPVVGDAPLYVTSASFAIDRRDLAADKLVLRGFLNPHGAEPQTVGATVTVSLEGEVLAGPFTLDAKGRSKSARSAAPKHRVTFDPQSGAFSVSLANLDLAERVPLADEDAADDIPLAVAVSVDGIGLEQASASADLMFRFTSKAGKSTKGKFSFRRDAEMQAVFAALRTQVSQGESLGSHRVKVKGALASAGAAPLLPVGPLTLRVGTAGTITIPATSLQLLGGGGLGGFRYKASLGDVPGLQKLTYDHGKRALKLVTGSQSGLGLPQDASLLAELDVRLDIPTAEGTRSFATTVELQRKSPTKTTWSR